MENTEATTSVATTGYSQPMWVAPTPPVDNQFYTKDYKFSPEEKKALGRLAALQDFRIFEKYLDFRVNACAHRMKTNLMNQKKDEAAMEAASIDALAKVTQDMEGFWKELKLAEEGINLVGEQEREVFRAFGDSKFSLNTPLE